MFDYEKTKDIVPILLFIPKITNSPRDYLKIPIYVTHPIHALVRGKNIVLAARARSERPTSLETDLPEKTRSTRANNAQTASRFGRLCVRRFFTLAHNNNNNNKEKKKKTGNACNACAPRERRRKARRSLLLFFCPRQFHDSFESKRIKQTNYFIIYIYSEYISSTTSHEYDS